MAQEQQIMINLIFNEQLWNGAQRNAANGNVPIYTIISILIIPMGMFHANFDGISVGVIFFGFGGFIRFHPQFFLAIPYYVC